MAMRYADRMARTAKPETYRFTTGTERLTKALSELGYRQTTIEDPSGAVCDLTATNKREYVHLISGGDTFNLARHEWKPLAHFLLDAAKYQEDQ
ncbi:hypothetical protein HMPREF2822_12325 [Corynebacterium sp. HMSC062E11]|nr:hypothetical protein HMPREF2822_12325 [Corynebacterium sp. HMSC062E11]